ncbi:MAG: hypothetical protein H8D43_01685, partial [Chloroflexi bacterium]|nr:hypothetical protein [Chloroflexota bacterium]
MFTLHRPLRGSIVAHWFALYTKPHKKYAVSRDLLISQKVKVYLPEIRTRTRRPGRRG